MDFNAYQMEHLNSKKKTSFRSLIFYIKIQFTFHRGQTTEDTNFCNKNIHPLSIELLDKPFHTFH